jgi:hypothetical protein
MRLGRNYLSPSAKSGERAPSAKASPRLMRHGNEQKPSDQRFFG